MMPSELRTKLLVVVVFLIALGLLSGASKAAVAPVRSSPAVVRPAEAPKQVVWGFLQAQKVGDIGGAAVACTSLSFDFWKKLGFTDDKGQISPTKCMYAFYNPLVSVFEMGTASFSGGSWKVNAVVNGVSMSFYVKKVDGNWKIVNMGRGPACGKECN